jgi:cytochrome d ubiquinol oxidase subunit I
MHTAKGVSLAVSATEVLVSMIVLTLLYGALAVVEVALLVRSAKAGPPEITTAEAELAYEQRSAERPLTFAY